MTTSPTRCLFCRGWDLLVGGAGRVIFLYLPFWEFQSLSARRTTSTSAFFPWFALLHQPTCFTSYLPLTLTLLTWLISFPLTDPSNLLVSLCPFCWLIHQWLPFLLLTLTYTKMHFLKALKWEIRSAAPESWFIFDQHCQSASLIWGSWALKDLQTWLQLDWPATSQISETCGETVEVRTTGASLLGIV